MYFDEPAEPFEPMPRALKIVLGITGVFVILFFAYPAPLVGSGGSGREVIVLMQLHPDADAAGVRLIAYDTLGSTNAEALARARAGERGPLWITAARQTAGRGRRGNVWVSEPGNLYASLLLTDAAPAAHLPELCFVVALARARCGRARSAPQLAPAAQAQMAERSAARRREVRRHPDRGGERRAAVTASAVGHRRELRAPSRRTRLSGDQSCGARRRGGAGRPVAALCRARWWRASRNGIAARALPPSAPNGSRMPPASAATSRCGFADRELTGTFETLDRTGRLMLRLPGGKLEAITAGEVFAHRAPQVTRLMARATNSCSRRSAASARSG